MTIIEWDDHVALTQAAPGEFAAAPATAEKLRGLGLQAQSHCGDAFARQLDAEVASATRIARELDLKVE